MSFIMPHRICRWGRPGVITANGKAGRRQPAKTVKWRGRNSSQRVSAIQIEAASPMAMQPVSG
jgi:hypothetical protein